MISSLLTSAKTKNYKFCGFIIQKFALSILHTLIFLQLTNNFVSSFDYSGEKLITLKLSNNNIKAIDLSKLPNLEFLLINHNFLYEIDLRGNKKLSLVGMIDNKIKKALMNL